MPQVAEATDDYWLISRTDLEAIALYVNGLRDWITVASACIEAGK